MKERDSREKKLCLRAGGLDVKEQEGRLLRPQEHQRNSHSCKVCSWKILIPNLNPRPTNYYFSFLMRRQLLTEGILLQVSVEGISIHTQPLKLQR